MKRKSKFAILLLMFVIACRLPAHGQEPSDEVIEINTDLVVLDAQVINKKTKQIVGDLKREDFMLYDDGARQQITYFSQDKLPLSIVLLLDMSRSVKPIFEQISNGALDALQHLKPEDEVALMAFGSSVVMVQDFTRDRELMSGKITNIAKTTDVGDATYLNRALYEAAQQTARASNPASRRVIIVVTDNIAEPSKNEMGQRAFTELFESGSVVSGLIVRAVIGTVLSLTPFVHNRALNPYAERTGGEILNANKREVETKLAELIDHLRTRYSFGYRPSNVGADGAFHRIEVQLTPAVIKQKGNLTVRVKEGYRARNRRTASDYFSRGTVSYP